MEIEFGPTRTVSPVSQSETAVWDMMVGTYRIFGAFQRFLDAYHLSKHNKRYTNSSLLRERGLGILPTDARTGGRK
jgi:hypothetical protein